MRIFSNCILLLSGAMVLAGCMPEATDKGNARADLKFVTCVKKPDGKWTFVGKYGEEFRAQGVDYVTYHGFVDGTTGKRDYEDANKRAFASKQAWSDDAIGKLKAWNFNLLGSGADRELYHRELYHIAFPAFMHFRLSGGPEIDKMIPPKFPNVFHPDWEAYCEHIAQRDCAPVSNDVDVLGYYLANELSWWGNGKGKWELGLFASAASLPDSHTAKQALLKFTGGTTNVSDDVKRGFVKLCAEKFFSNTVHAIRRYDTNHLVLGVRFMGLPHGGAIDEVWQIAGKYCDVLSLNVYPHVNFTNNVLYAGRTKDAPVLTEELARKSALGGRPLLISEWSFLGLDSGLPCKQGAGTRYQTQQERAAAISVFLKQMDDAPCMVGHNFFMWVDEPAGGLSNNGGENSNYGLVNAAGVPYGPVVRAFGDHRGNYSQRK